MFGRARARWIVLGIATSVIVVMIIGIVWASTFLLARPAPVGGGIDDLTFTVNTDKASYAAGEEVIVTTNLTNTGTAPVTLTYGDSCRGRMVIRDVNGTIWFVTKSEETCAQVITEIAIGAGESIVATFAWGQQDLLEDSVPSGQWYRIQAFEGAVGNAGVATESELFYIRPGG